MKNKYIKEEMIISRLLDLYNIPLQTNDYDIAMLFINQEVAIRQKSLISKTKLQCL